MEHEIWILLRLLFICVKTIKEYILFILNINPFRNVNCITRMTRQSATRACATY